jgi:hypothetical protein
MMELAHTVGLSEKVRRDAQGILFVFVFTFANLEYIKPSTQVTLQMTHAKTPTLTCLKSNSSSPSE